MKKIRFLFDGNFEIAGRDRHYRRGDTEEVDDADAERLIVGLCAEEWEEGASEPLETPKPRKARKVGEHDANN